MYASAREPPSDYPADLMKGQAPGHILIWVICHGHKSINHIRQPQRLFQPR